MDKIITYLQEKYMPLSIIVYGSYANGTNDLNSDFDALVIYDDSNQIHDTSFVNGIQLDVFVYPLSYFEKVFDCERFVQIFDGKLIIDHNQIGKKIISDVKYYLKNHSFKTDTEIQSNIAWCVKMLNRAKRCDCEGVFRWHWVLVDSLEIFCDVMRQPYLGPKKTLKWMEENHNIAYNYYSKALKQFDMESLEKWILYLQNIK